MMDLIRSIVIYALVVVLIIGLAWLYKRSDSVTIEPTDHSLDTSGFTNGGYRIQPADEYKGGDGGDAVAYWVPGMPGTARVAKVLAIGGDKLEFERKNPADAKAGLVIRINGKLERGFSTDSQERFPELVVPRGCLYLLTDKSAQSQDSVMVGPVPLYCVRGKVSK